MNFSRGVGGVFVTLVEIPRGWGVISSLQKWKIQGGGGVLNEIPFVVGVWIFSGLTQSLHTPFWGCDYISCISYLICYRMISLQLLLDEYMFIAKLHSSGTTVALCLT